MLMQSNPSATKMLTSRLACLLTGTLALLFSSQPGLSAAPAYTADLPLVKRSAAGPYSYTGRLLVRDTKGQNLGFVRNNLQDDGTIRADFGNVGLHVVADKSLRLSQASSTALLFWFQGDTNGDREPAPGVSLQIVRQYRTEGEEYLWLAGVQSTAHNVGDHLAPGSAKCVSLPDQEVLC